MILIILESVDATVRGALSRWLIEPRPGVFVGRVSALVRDKIWEACVTKSKGGGGILIHQAQTEQGFIIKTFGDTGRETVDFDGLTLVRIHTGKREEASLTTQRKPSKRAKRSTIS